MGYLRLSWRRVPSFDARKLRRASRSHAHTITFTLTTILTLTTLILTHFAMSNLITAMLTRTIGILTTHALTILTRATGTVFRPLCLIVFSLLTLMILL